LNENLILSEASENEFFLSRFGKFLESEKPSLKRLPSKNFFVLSTFKVSFRF